MRIVASNSGDVMLGIGMELLLLGIGTGIANSSDELGSIMLVFIIGLLLVWLMHHYYFTNAIPNIFTYLHNKGVP